MTKHHAPTGWLQSVRHVFVLPQLLFLIIVGLEVFACIYVNGGRFCYTLDDPYIHLALAENLARGHYGLIPGIPAAPSSSALWPLLLAPFGRFMIVEWLPLAINLVASMVTIAIIRRLVEGWLQPASRRMHTISAALTTAAFLGMNVVGVALTGMEHSLQLTATVAVLWGLIRIGETGRAPSWLVVALIAGPLIRYESLAISVPAILLLGFDGHRRIAAVSGAAIVAGLGAFSVALHSMGIGWFPTSVVAKSRLVADAAAPSALAVNVLRSLAERQGAVLAVLGALLLVFTMSHNRGRDSRLAIWGVAAIGLHFLAGSFGFQRYEIYLIGPVILLLLHLNRDKLSTLVRTAPPIGIAALLTVATAAVGFPYLYGLYTGPIASNNIYEQQYQMHRFVTEYYPATIAANDIGWLSYGNDNEVLDLWGISSTEVLARRNGARGVNWIDELAVEHGVEYAILYDLFFPDLPAGWKRVAEMTISRRLVAPASRTVVFHAVAPGSRERLVERLRAFEGTLPEGVRLTFLAPSGND